MGGFSGRYMCEVWDFLNHSGPNKAIKPVRRKGVNECLVVCVTPGLNSFTSCSKSRVNPVINVFFSGCL